MLLLVLHLVATAFMTGLIWFVQVVHYPLFQQVPDDRFEHYQAQHMNLTTRVVAPAMLIELVTSALVLIRTPESLQWTALLLLGLIWLSTAILQVPCHQRLCQGFCLVTARRLVATNWIRTIAWSLRTILAGAMILAA